LSNAVNRLEVNNFGAGPAECGEAADSADRAANGSKRSDQGDRNARDRGKAEAHLPTSQLIPKLISKIDSITQTISVALPSPFRGRTTSELSGEGTS
jgi:hypothetical protein